MDTVLFTGLCLLIALWLGLIAKDRKDKKTLKDLAQRLDKLEYPVSATSSAKLDCSVGITIYSKAGSVVQIFKISNCDEFDTHLLKDGCREIVVGRKE